MNRVLCQILAAFIPNKEKRKNFRKKHKSILKKMDEKFESLYNEINYLNQQVYPFVFDVFQDLCLLKCNDVWDPRSLLKKIKNSPSYLPVDCKHNYLNFLLNVPEWSYECKSFSTDKVLLCWEIRPVKQHIDILLQAQKRNIPMLYVGDSFLRSINTHSDKKALPRYHKGISFTIDDLTSYFDASRPSRLEKMLNDENLTLSSKQLERAKVCISKIVKNHLTKYNSQPIFTPDIGRNGVKKVLVVDQSYGDMSILKGNANDLTFKNMLQAAIDENPDADIIVKTHPDTMTGRKGGYYTDLKPYNNVYTQTEPINPISLIQYVDKIYVCTTQFGFEALMCGKEVHVFGMPFYAGWGLTHDRQKCERRTNKRSLEELFYIAYIMYSYYVNPDTGKQCEIEEAMDYLLKLREEYFKMRGEYETNCS